MATAAIGRLLWLLLCAVGTALGWLLAVGAQRLAGTDGVLVPLVGTLGGLAVGNVRGWHARLRRAGLPASGLAAWVAPAGWVAAVGVALLVEASI